MSCIVCLDDFPELITLDSRDCMNDSVSTSLYALEETGKKQYQTFVKTVLEDHTASIHDSIKKHFLASYISQCKAVKVI